jgi:CheY-like chemotaxis protein
MKKAKPSQGSGQQRAGGQRPNTLGLDRRELANLLDFMDLPEAAPKTIRRDFIRWPFRRPSVAMRIEHAGGAQVSITVACRNISRGGMSLLHSGYMHPGTQVTVTLPCPKGELAVRGWVARCNHRSGMIHEIGVAFKEPLDVRDVVQPDRFADFFSFERVRPEELTGSVLYIDDCAGDVRVARHFLRGTRLTFRSASGIAQALAVLHQDFDVILCDFILEDGAGAEFVNAARERGCRTPILMVICDAGAVARGRLADLPVDGFLAKPLTQQRMLRAMAEFLLSGRRIKSIGIAPTVATNVADRFVRSIEVCAARLQMEVESDDAAACRAVCMQIATTAPGVGFKHLGEVAKQAARMLAATGRVSQSIRAVRQLIDACERIRGRSAA